MTQQVFELNAYFFKIISVTLRQFPNDIDLELFLPSIGRIGMIPVLPPPEIIN